MSVHDTWKKEQQEDESRSRLFPSHLNIWSSVMVSVWGSIKRYLMEAWWIYHLCTYSFRIYEKGKRVYRFWLLQNFTAIFVPCIFSNDVELMHENLYFMWDLSRSPFWSWEKIGNVKWVCIRFSFLWYLKLFMLKEKIVGQEWNTRWIWMWLEICNRLMSLRYFRSCDFHFHASFSFYNIH